jgi:DNA-binding transcriptional MerR regulator
MRSGAARTYSIAEAAHKAGLSLHRVRVYLDMGLVQAGGATAGGYRLFDATCIELVK